MKAVVTSGYGPVSVLSVEDVEKPQIGDEEILVRIRACSVNPIDWKIRSGQAKIMSGLTPPKILGGDFSGTVDAVGNRVTDFRVGEEIWGHFSAAKGGAYAEQIKVDSNNICLKPKNFDFIEAASVPLAGLTAYQSMVYGGGAKSGNEILINGCTGGVGSSAVQIGKYLDCRVTGVCSTKNIEFAKRIGVDEIVDYKQDDVLQLNREFDSIYDFVGNMSFKKTKHLLKENGSFVTAIPGTLLYFFGGMVNRFRSKKSIGMLVRSSSKNLETLKIMAESEKLVPTVEKVYPLDQVQEAHTRSESGRVVGKLVLTVD